jgi:hypothetical protein
LRKLAGELAARGIQTNGWAAWTLVHDEGLGFKKTIRQAEQIVPISPVNAHAGRPIKAGLTLRALRQFRRKMVYRARRCVRDLVVMLQRGGAAPECRFAKKSLLARIMLLQAAGAA